MLAATCGIREIVGARSVFAEPAVRAIVTVADVTRYPKIELRVHLGGTVRAPTLRQIAKRNGYPLPDDLESRRRFRDFSEFIEVFELRMGALQAYEDFRSVVDYAAEAASHGATYVEAIFSPGLWRGNDRRTSAGCREERSPPYR